MAAPTTRIHVMVMSVMEEIVETQGSQEEASSSNGTAQQGGSEEGGAGAAEQDAGTDSQNDATQSEPTEAGAEEGTDAQPSQDEVISTATDAAATAESPLVEVTEEVVDDNPLADLSWTSIAAAGMELLILLAIAVAVQVLVRRVLIKVVHRVAESTKTWWDDVLTEEKVFERMAPIAPMVVLHIGVLFVSDAPTILVDFVQRVTLAVIAVLGARGIATFLTGLNTIYTRYESSRDRPIKGYIQVIQVVIYLVAIILAIAALMNRSPWFFVTGLGAMTAVLLLVFRDTLLSLVAGIQLTSNDLIRVGDWIEVPSFGADGDVIDIALNSVRVQNWDKTVTSIPTHKFLDHSFKNWRPMFGSGGRRIARSLNIDIQSIRFLTDDELPTLKKVRVLAPYLEARLDEVTEFNNQQLREGNSDIVLNKRALTNLGTFRHYAINWLRENPRINQEMTLLVRQLQPTPEGLPIQVYVFSRDTSWASYEDLQSDIFDHLYAILPQFGLRAFQQPTGTDLRESLGARYGQNMDPQKSNEG